ncbi:hypothetical protein [Candidatus Hecatella orcuttiae]|uniref:ribonuclease P protein component 4 n=1 Tax=Candidatus Hecatella orcuttiae TaxID=1935119 RepID=UPI0028680BC9|nr:hypothetical protein [Candidatus Hecatella orcuttiae]
MTKTPKGETKQIARERVNILLNLALETHRQHPNLAQRYVHLARKIAMKHKVRLPARWRTMVCRTCNRLLIPGLTSRVRIQERREPHLTITCLQCGRIKRLPFKSGGRRADKKFNLKRLP